MEDQQQKLLELQLQEARFGPGRAWAPGPAVGGAVPGVRNSFRSPWSKPLSCNSWENRRPLVKSMISGLTTQKNKTCVYRYIMLVYDCVLKYVDKSWFDADLDYL